MIRLIVNADDLGSGRQRDRGIFRAFAHGIVTSASLLANGPDFAAAVREALACGLPVGVHLNLSEGISLTGDISGLTDAHGQFPGKRRLREVLCAGTFDRAGVHRELVAQVERVRATGIAPDHLDTHQHCLLFPALTGVIAEVAETTSIRALRLPLPAESGEGDSGTGTPPPDRDDPAKLSAELALYRQLAPAARQLLRDRPLWTPAGLWGMPLLNRLDEASLAETLACIPAGTWELMTHPGLAAPAEPFGGQEREVELRALTAPAIRQLVDERGIALTTFGACACGC